MKFKKIISKLFFLITIFSFSVTSLSSCGWFDSFISDANSWFNSVGDDAESWFGEVGEWFEDAANEVVTFFTGPVSDWWNGVVDGASKVVDDVSDWIVDGYNKVSTSICDFYTGVKDGVITFYNSVVETFSFKEVDRSTLDYELGLGDNEVLVYSIIDNLIGTNYETFPAYVYHPITNELIDGLGFTNNQEHFVSDEGEKYFGAGFIAGFNESFIENNVIDAQGVEIYKYGNDTDNKYVYSYEIKPFDSHFIANNKYVQFGVNSNNQFYLTEKDNTGQYGSESVLGGLYDYDKGGWVFGSENDFIQVNGRYFDSIKSATSNEINDANNGNDLKGYSLTVDQLINGISNSVYSAKQYIEKMDGNNILGVNKDEVSSKLDDIKASDVISTENQTVSFENIPDKSTPNSTEIAKIIAIVCTVASIVGTIALGFLGVLHPPVLALMSGFSSMCMELTLQLAIKNRNLSEVKWYSVILKGVFGAMSAKCNFLGDAALEALSESIIAYGIEGEGIESTFMIFVESFISSLIFSAIFSIAFKVGGLLKKGVKKAINNARNADVHIATRKLRKASPDLADEMDDIARNSKRAAKDAVDDSTTSAAVLARKQGKLHLPADDNPNFIKTMKNGDEILNSNGSVKKAIQNNDPIYIRLRPDASEDVVAIMKKHNLDVNDAIAIYKDGHTIFAKAVKSVEIDSGFIGVSRTKTFAQADKVLADQFRNNPNSIPKVIKEWLDSNDIPTSAIKQSTLAQIRQELRLTWHEVSDKALQLVFTDVHMLVAHSGGYQLGKIIIALNNAVSLIEGTLKAA